MPEEKHMPDIPSPLPDPRGECLCGRPLEFPDEVARRQCTFCWMFGDPLPRADDACVGADRLDRYRNLFYSSIRDD
jgi:hypothetical protein